jgi:hypothetical protein
MASLKEIEKELQRAKTEYDKYKVSANTDGSYTVAGKKVSSKDFGEARKKAKQKVDELTKTKRGFSNAQKTITGLQKTNQTLAKSLTRGSGSEATNATVQNQITANNARIAAITALIIVIFTLSHALPRHDPHYRRRHHRHRRGHRHHDQCHHGRPCRPHTHLHCYRDRALYVPARSLLLYVLFYAYAFSHDLSQYL